MLEKTFENEMEHPSNSLKKTQSSCCCIDLSLLNQDLNDFTERKQQEERELVTTPTKNTTSFGGRLLTQPDLVYSHNAWDHVECDEDTLRWAESQLEFQQTYPCLSFQSFTSTSTSCLDTAWNTFYTHHQDHFFKHRRWLKIEFPELFDPFISNSSSSSSSPSSSSCMNIMELGCGVGNTVFPLLEVIPSTHNVQLFACDFSATAISVLKQHPSFDPKRIQAFVYDITSPTLPKDVVPNSMDFILLIFVLSALVPETLNQALQNIKQLLKPGGIILFRDYARLDLAQLRFKKHRWIQPNFYTRGDGTLVHFFDLPQLRSLIQDQHGFIINSLGLDQRLLVNRSKKIQMHRRWVQGKFQKPFH